MNLIKNQIIQKFQNHKIKKEGCKTKDSLLKPFDKIIMFNEFKMFKFRCAKFDSTPTLVQISNYKIPLLDRKFHIILHIVMEHVPSHLDRCLSIHGNVLAW